MRRAASLLIAAHALSFALAASPARADDLEVCASCRFKTLQGAIDAAASGSTITVRPGEYKESEILIRKPLTIIGGRGGSPRPVIDSQRRGNVFFVNAPGVRIAGLVIRNSGTSATEDYAGIKLSDSSGCELRDNVLEGNFFAIYLARTSDCVIEENHIVGGNVPSHEQGNGIHLWYSHRVRITRNVVTRHRDGIYFEFVKDSRTDFNNSFGNSRYGMHFMFSDHDEYTGNVFTDNGAGVAVMYSKNIRMLDNRFEKSWGGAAYGILLKDIAASEIRGNHFVANTVGLYLDGMTRSTIEGNEFRGNGWALRVLGNSDTNVVRNNNFIKNTFDASTNASGAGNDFTGNYWSAYEGLDLDRDGVGDSGYRPLRLSSMLMEKFGVSVLLLKSFFFTLADEAERQLPVLTPEAFQDRRPLMKPVAIR